MTEQEDELRRISRRGFLKGAAVAAAGAAGAGVLASCGTPKATPTSEAASPQPTPAAVAEKWAFETPPTPIPDKDIKNTVTTEIVIVGGGTSGLICANAAIENGAKVALLSASIGPVSRGGANFAFNSRAIAKYGIQVDVTKAMKTQLAAQMGRVDQNKWWLFARKSGEAMDWLCSKMEAEGYETYVERPAYIDPEGVLTLTAGTHGWMGGDIPAGAMCQPFVVKLLVKKLLEQGGTIDWSTRAVQLIRENNNTGRVSAVVAEAPDGSYTKYVGTKAIVLATGDFTRDKDMVAKYCPEVVDLVSTAPIDYSAGLLPAGGIYPGDGHKMGLWVGAAWQRIWPNAQMTTSMGSVGNGSRSLFMNKNGERFMNEDTLDAFVGCSQMEQPERMMFEIWSPKLAERGAPWYMFGTHYDADPLPPDAMLGMWEDFAKMGATPFGVTYFKGNTIDEVAQKLGLPIDAAKATIARYNQFCENGVDEDFNKHKSWLFPVDEGPFYGAMALPLFGICMGGLRCNTKMQVLDEKDQVIPGLYVVGTIVGDMYAIYNFGFGGNNLGGNCTTFGYLTGKGLAQGTV